MYYNSLPRIPFSSRPISTVLRAKYFLFSKCYFLGSKFQAQVLKFYSALMINTPSTVTVHDYHTSRCMHARDTLLWYFKQGVQRFPLSLKEQSVQIVRVCTQQCEWVLAHRIRRGQQIFSLYSKLWDEVALKELMKKMRHQLSRRGKEFLLTAAGMSVFNWEEERIPDEEVLGHLNELEAVYKLCDYTITCRQCRKRMVVDAPLPSIDYCKCSHKTHCFEKDVCGWKPFLEREDLLVWRKEDEVFHGLYVYKVYGKYHDVAAKDFLKVQIDTDFRKTWDNTAINLKVVEQDSASNSDIVYWEMKWPRMFSNRDYVFNRRYLIDQENNIIVVINKGTEHPNVPENPQNHRVKDYWSFMVIKACTDIDEPGMEFSLTYFDNPGVSLPSSITAWVAMTGLPDFQCRLRQAARDYRKHRDQTDLTKAHTDGSRSELRADSGYKQQSQTRSKPEEKWDPSTELGIKLNKTPSHKPSDNQPSQTQEHTTSSSASRMYLRQFHAWQLFI